MTKKELKKFIKEVDEMKKKATEDFKNMPPDEKAKLYSHVCPICYKENLRIWGRYPNYVCGDCYSKATDIYGRKLVFYNVSIGGGYQAFYKDNEKREYKSHDCYIEGIKCHADEAYLDGIVIQKIIYKNLNYINLFKKTQILTPKKIDFFDIYHLLESEGHKYMFDFPKGLKDSFKNSNIIFLPDISTSFLKLTEIFNGYKITIPFLACHEDYLLYRDIIKHFFNLTNGMVVYEEKQLIKNPESFFTNGWILQNIKKDIDILLEKLKNNQDITIKCFYRDYCIGNNLVTTLADYNDKIKFADNIFNSIRKSQYIDRDLYFINSSIYEIISSDYRDKTITPVANSENYFIGYAHFIALVDKSTETVLSFPFDKLYDIKPDRWKLYDEKQYYAPKLNDDEWKTLWNKAKDYQIHIKYNRA